MGRLAGVSDVSYPNMSYIKATRLCDRDTNTPSSDLSKRGYCDLRGSACFNNSDSAASTNEEYMIYHQPANFSILHWMTIGIASIEMIRTSICALCVLSVSTQVSSIKHLTPEFRKD